MVRTPGARPTRSSPAPASARRPIPSTPAGRTGASRRCRRNRCARGRRTACAPSSMPPCVTQARSASTMSWPCGASTSSRTDCQQRRRLRGLPVRCAPRRGRGGIRGPPDDRHRGGPRNGAARLSRHHARGEYPGLPRALLRARTGWRLPPAGRLRPQRACLRCHARPADACRLVARQGHCRARQDRPHRTGRRGGRACGEARRPAGDDCRIGRGAASRVPARPWRSRYAFAGGARPCAGRRNAQACRPHALPARGRATGGPCRIGGLCQHPGNDG